MPDDHATTSPGFFRYLAVIFYDALLLLAVLFFATALILPFNQGQAFTNSHFLYPLYLLTISFIYFGWFWTHGGQTPALKTWKLRVLDFKKQPLSWKQALIRFVFAIFSWIAFGAGFFWSLVDNGKLTWHDRLSKSRLYPLA